MSDETFYPALRTGFAMQHVVAGMLTDEGLEVTHVTDEVVPIVGWSDRFLDECDVVCNGAALEVKSRTFAFTGPEDYPYATAFCGTVRGWQMTTQVRHAVVLISQPTHGIAVVPVSTRGHWERVRAFDKVDGRWQESYACPRDLLRTFGELVDWLRRRTVP